MFFLVSSIPSSSYTLSVFSAVECLSSDREGFDGAIPFRAGCFRVSYSQCSIWMWTSMHVAICDRRKLLWWWWTKALIDKHSRVSLAVINITTFFLVLDEYYLVLSWVSVVFSLRFLVTQAPLGMGSISWSGPKSNQILIHYSHKFASPLPWHIL